MIYHKLSLMVNITKKESLAPLPVHCSAVAKLLERPTLLLGLKKLSNFNWKLKGLYEIASQMCYEKPKNTQIERCFVI